MMKSLEYSDEERLDRVGMLEAPPERIPGPKFPPEMRFTLTEREFELLGLDHSEAVAGGLFHFRGVGCLEDVTQKIGKDGEPPCCRVVVQIVAFGIESEEEENEENEEEE